MKRVLLVYPGYIVREQPLNVLYIGSAVKAAGHAVALYEISPYRRRPLRGDPYRIIKEKYAELCARFRPDVIGFSVMSVNYRIALELARLTKKTSPDVWTVFGGIHPTIAPEETIQEGAIDVLCRGEGEASFTEFLSALDRGGDYARIPGLWIKRDSQVFRNPMKPLIEDLDKIPSRPRAARPRKAPGGALRHQPLVFEGLPLPLLVLSKRISDGPLSWIRPVRALPEHRQCLRRDRRSPPHVQSLAAVLLG